MDGIEQRIFSQQFSGQDDVDSFGTERVDKMLMISSELHWVDGVREQKSVMCCWADELKLFAWHVHEYGA
jgi:hypothetical protein